MSSRLLWHHLPRLADHLHLSTLRARGYESRHVGTSVGKVHVLVAKGAGALPPIVVLHGLSAAGQYYESLLVRLRPHVRRVLAPDMPGHGHSDRPEQGMHHHALGQGLGEALDAVLDEPAVIFGNSLGGAAAVRYAAARPERVRALVLAAPGGAPTPETDRRDFLRTFELRSHGAALDFVDRLFHRPHPLRHLLAVGIRQQFSRFRSEELLRSVAPEDQLRAEELSALRMPVLVLWGGADRVLLPAHRSFFERHLPGHARLEAMPRAGHVPHMCHPDALAERVLDFVRAC